VRSCEACALPGHSGLADDVDDFRAHGKDERGPRWRMLCPSCFGREGWRALSVRGRRSDVLVGSAGAAARAIDPMVIGRAAPQLDSRAKHPPYLNLTQRLPILSGCYQIHPRCCAKVTAFLIAC